MVNGIKYRLLAELSEKTMAEIPMLVQELVENDENMVPDSYLLKDTDCEQIDLTVPFATDIPVIDFRQLVFSTEMNAELKKLRLALSSWGCFQLINHGVEGLFLDEIRKVSRQFFHMPSEEKKRYARSVDDIEGYGSDLILFENQLHDWVDRLVLSVTPPDKQKLQYWPQNPQYFRNILLEYTTHIARIQGQLLRSIARSISLPSDSFLKQFGKRPIRHARFNYYPPCSRPDLVNGLKPHTDGSGLTFLLQDEDVEGLQILNDNKWFRVPIVRQALLVNLGDQLEIMSNGIFKSAVHRAVTNSKHERMTLALFCAPDPEQDIGPAAELIDQANQEL